MGRPVVIYALRIVQETVPSGSRGKFYGIFGGDIEFDLPETCYGDYRKVAIELLSDPIAQAMRLKNDVTPASRIRQSFEAVGHLEKWLENNCRKSDDMDEMLDISENEDEEDLSDRPMVGRSPQGEDLKDRPMVRGDENEFLS